MRNFKMTALVGALACGLALSACATDDATTTDDTTTTAEAQAGFGIPLNADGTVDSDLFIELTEEAEANISSQIFTNRFVDPETREPLSEDMETTYADVDPERLYNEVISEGQRFEIYFEDGQSWTRVDGGEWEVDETALDVEEDAEEIEEPVSQTVEIVDLDARTFLITETYADDSVYENHVIVDEEMHITESFVDYGDGTALLQNTTNINEPVEFPEDLPV